MPVNRKLVRADETRSNSTPMSLSHGSLVTMPLLAIRKLFECILNDSKTGSVIAPLFTVLSLQSHPLIVTFPLQVIRKLFERILDDFGSGSSGSTGMTLSTALSSGPRRSAQAGEPRVLRLDYPQRIPLLPGQVSLS